MVTVENIGDCAAASTVTAVLMVIVGIAMGWSYEFIEAMVCISGAAATTLFVCTSVMVGRRLR